jgi:ankyrin repeat protein
MKTPLALLTLAALVLVTAPARSDQAGAREKLETQNAPSLEYGRTILFQAVDTGEAEYVRVLAEAGADAKAANEYGVTPLAEAARTGNLEMCKILLKAGADPNAAAGGFPLLYGPVNESHIEVVRLLLASGAKLGEHKQGLVEAAKEPELRALLEAVE